MTGYRTLLAAVLVLGAASASDPTQLRFVGAPLRGFRLAYDLAVGPNGLVVILEDVGKRVTQIDPQGRQHIFRGIQAPRGVAVDEAGRVVIVEVETGAAHLTAFAGHDLLWRRELKGGAAPAKPVATAARDGVVWIVDRSPPRLLLYAYDGASLGGFDLHDHARTPFALALGPSGEAFVTDPLGPAVLTFSPSGAYQGTVDLDGTGVVRPSGVAVGPDGSVFVSDGVTGTIAVLRSVGTEWKVEAAIGGLRFQDPLRLAWGHGSLWVLEGIPGRVRRVQTEEP